MTPCHSRAARSALCSAALFLAASTAASQIDIALCAAASSSNTACQWTDVQTTLMATGQFNTVDIINVYSATPTLAQLQGYDALLCWTNVTPNDTNAWGDVLADYVDSGGGVVVAVFANSTTTTNRNIGGRWQNGYEVVLDQSGNASGSGGTLGTVHVPGHPVMAGVTTFTGGTIGSRPNGTALEVGSTLIAEWNDGKVLVAAGARTNRVDLGFYPPSASCSQSGWATGGDLLMANALRYVATAAAYYPYGSGCPGSLGVPALGASPGTLPALGTTLTVTVDNVPLNVGIMVTGFSDTMSSGFMLPLDLTSFGLPGCSLLAEVFATQFLVTPTTTTSWSLTIPNSTTFAGARFYNQAFVYDPPANTVGLTVSNAGAGRVGL